MPLIAVNLVLCGVFLMDCGHGRRLRFFVGVQGSSHYSDLKCNFTNVVSLFFNLELLHDSFTTSITDTMDQQIL